MLLQDFFLRIKWRMRAGARISLLSAFTPDCRFGRNARVERMCALHGAALGDYSYVGDGTRILFAEIGRFCSVSGSVLIGLGRHPADMVSTSPAFYTNRNAVRTHWLEREPGFEEHGRITIGSDVWIGARAIVRDGVTVGHGAVIGAGAVVTKDVPPYAVVAGVPAREIRKRFDDDTVARLLALKWWDWPDDKIKRNATLFADAKAFLANFNGE